MIFPLQMVEPRPGASFNDCHLEGVLRAWTNLRLPCVLFTALSAGGQTGRTAVVILPICGRYLMHMAQNFKRYRWYE